MIAVVVNEHGGDQVSDPKTWDRYQFNLDSDTDRAIDQIAAEMADVLRLPRPNRSDALRRIVLEFDVEGWVRRNAPTREPAQAAA
jgi:hypothetical protein